MLLLDGNYVKHFVVQLAMHNNIFEMIKMIQNVLHLPLL